jgi:hypothetical protein
VDACGNDVSGIDANEVLGTNYNDISNNWGLGPANGVYMSSYLINDDIITAGNVTPASEVPQTPLTTTAVHHDYPRALRVGSQTLGSGTPVRVDSQQWWLDHGTHQ